MTNASDFVIETGVLKKYTGRGGDVVIPNGVTSIGIWAFNDCESLTNIAIPDGVTSIGEGAFSSCDSLMSITLPDGVTGIGYMAFAHCSGLTSITIPDSVMSIGKEAFRKCSGLTDITIPGSVTSIGEGAFSGCISLTSIEVAANNAVYHSTGNCLIETASKILIAGCYTGMIPADGSVTSIGNEAFAFCTGLTSITIPDSVTSIGDDAFSGCDNLTHMALSESAKVKLGRVFGGAIPKGLSGRSDELFRFMNAEGIKHYVADLWANLSDDSKAEIFLTHQDQKMRKQYKKLLKPAEPDPLSAAILRRLGAKMTKKECGILADFMVDYLAFLSGPGLKAIYDAIASQKKTGADALKVLNANKGLKKKMKTEPAPRADMGLRTKNDVAFDNMGFDHAGVKIYDLGTKRVRATLQPDLGILIYDTATGKASKSIPKKGSDPSLYAAASEDFKALSKAVKALVATCRDGLYRLYLSAEELPAKTWKAEWTGNFITRTLASMVVWQQGDSFFSPDGEQTITVDGTPYSLADTPVRVACTADMERETIAAWQHRFVACKQKQPFLQIWEPIRKLEDIREDRYAGCTISGNYFRNKQALGIQVSFRAEDFGEEPCHCDIALTDFTIETRESTDVLTLEITKIRPLKWDRRSNAVISFLDRVCIYGKIHHDDVSIVESLPQFTLAQITDFIKLASDNNCPNCTAALLEYKNANFADFDPMAEFTLE